MLLRSGALVSRTLRLQAPLCFTAVNSKRWFSPSNRVNHIHETHEIDPAHPEYRVPTADTALRQARRFQECDNESLFIMSVDGEFGARQERLIREVMRVDNVSWFDAYAKVSGEINEANDGFAWLVRLPYMIGFTSGLAASATAIPLVFHRPTAHWFCETFVYEDLPDGGIEALDSVWKVGNWTWGWMEPYLGTASFVLLGLQFTRINMQRLHWKPYTEKVLSWRANRLAARYPQYDREIVRGFSKADRWD